MYRLLEVNVGTTCACLPHLKPLVLRCLPKLLEKRGESSSRSYPLTTQVEARSHSPVDIIDSMGISEVEEVEPCRGQLPNFLTTRRDQLE